MNVIAGTNGFSIVNSLFYLNTGTDASTVSTYDVTGRRLMQLRPGALSGECGAADIQVPGKERLLLTELVSTRPAQGITAATYSVTLSAWSASSGHLTWRSTLVPSTPGTGIVCAQYEGNLRAFSATSDGRWGVWLSTSSGPGGAVIDLATGRLRPDPNLRGTLGSFVADATGRLEGAPYQLVDPASGGVLGTVQTDQNVNGISFNNHVEIAPRGLFPTESAGSSPPAGTSIDGRTLFAIPNEHGNSQGSGMIVAYSLPDMHSIWQMPASYAPSIWGAGAVLIAGMSHCSSSGDACLIGLDTGTGAHRWQLPPAEVCAVTNSQALLAINGQLAIIDLASGKQVSYRADNSGACPTVLSGGIEAVPLSGGIVVTQALAP